MLIYRLNTYLMPLVCVYWASVYTCILSVGNTSLVGDISRCKIRKSFALNSGLSCHMSKDKFITRIAKSVSLSNC